MFFRTLMDRVRRLLAIEEPSVSSVVSRCFPQHDAPAAVKFYEPWHKKKWLEMQLGNGLHELEREQFFESGWINFVWPPFEAECWLVLGMDAEDEMGTVALKPNTGEVFYVYDDYPVLLSNSFTGFLRDLEMAGWCPPS